MLYFLLYKKKVLFLYKINLMGNIGKKINSNDKEKQAYAFYLSKGWSPLQSAAIVGNLLHESGLNPSSEGDIGYKGGSSRGIAQFRGDRLKRLKSQYGDNWTDFGNQLEFVNWELNNTHKNAGDALRKTNDIYDAGRIVSDKYEIPAVKFNANKDRQKKVFNTYSKLSGLDTGYEKYIPNPIGISTNTSKRAFELVEVPNFIPTREIMDLDTQNEIKNTEAEIKAKEDIAKVTNEQQILQDYFSSNTQVKKLVEQPQLVSEVEQFPNLIDQYAQVSQFIDNPLAQEGGVIYDLPINTPNPITPRQFTIDYINSPKYRERLIKSGYEDVDEEIKIRLAQANPIVYPYKPAPQNSFIDNILGKKQPVVERGSYHNPLTGSIQLDTSNDIKGFKDLYPNFIPPIPEEIEAHERSHGVLNNFPGTRLNITDVRKLSNNHKTNNVPEHDLIPGENKADLDAFRYMLKREGIYDSGKQDFTPELLKRAKDSATLDRLRSVYSDKDIIYLMNNVASLENLNSNNYAQEGGAIGNLTPVQTKDVENQREWINYWNSNRVVGGKKINENSDIPFSSDVYIDDLNYGNSREYTLGEFDSISNRLILDTKYQSKPGIPVHEFSHRYQKYLNPGIYQQYISNPISKALQQTQGSSEYHGNVDENQAELNRLRYNSGFKPNQIITPQDLQKYKSEDYNLKHFSEEQLINLLNSTADNSYSDLTYAQQGGKTPVSSNGVYDFPMQEVIVPTKNGNITMSQVGYPILGIDEYGNKQLMMPGKEYKFPGKTIYEIPQLQQYFNKR